MSTPNTQPDTQPTPKPDKRWRLAIQHSAPVAMGYLPAGIAFGVLMSAAGLPLWLTLAMSLILYSGAAQYAAIPLLATGAGPSTLALNTLIINLRHVFYGLPLLDSLPLGRLQRAYALFALTDESFSVLTTLPSALQRPLFVPIVFLNQCYWCVASLVGALIGAGLNEAVPHLDFALVCLFLILAYEQFQSKRAWWPCILALAAFALAKALTADYVLLTAVGLCVAAIVLRAAWQGKGGAA